MALIVVASLLYKSKPPPKGVPSDSTGELVATVKSLE
jgi:hypothetical protein